jgi:Na+/proline symporter
MMLAATHLALRYTIPVLVALAVLLGWYWHRLGESDVPPSRRGIRRASLLVMFLGLMLATAGTSLIDPDTQGRAYVMTWSAVLALVFACIFMALLDVLNNVRLHREHCEHQIERFSDDLMRVMKRKGSAGSRKDET